MTSKEKLEKQIEEASKKKAVKPTPLNEVVLKMEKTEDETKSERDLREKMSNVVDALDKVATQKRVKIDNWEEQPREVEITNFPEQVKEVKITNPTKEVEVNNFPDIPQPKDYEKSFLSVVKTVASLPILIAKEIGKQVQSVNVVNEKPFRVLLVDPKDKKPYKAGSGYVSAGISSSAAPKADEPRTAQTKVAVTGTAVQLPSKLAKNGVLIRNGGTTDVLVGDSTVTNTADGTGNGMILGPKETTSLAIKNTNTIYINGTANTSWVSILVS